MRSSAVLALGVLVAACAPVATTMPSGVGASAEEAVAMSARFQAAETTRLCDLYTLSLIHI